MRIFTHKKSKIWWYEFEFNGKRYRKSTKTTSKTRAQEALLARHRQLEDEYNGIIKKRESPKSFTEAAEEYLQFKEGNLASGALEIERRAVRHLQPYFQNLGLADITPVDIKRFIKAKLAEGVTPRGVNMKLATFRAILRRNHEWERLRPDFSMVPEPDEEHGKALSRAEEDALLAACKQSLNLVLYVVVVLSLYTAMRLNEIRLLKWKQINLVEESVVVGKSKTSYGQGRKIPLVGAALQALTAWAELFPNRLPEHYAFPSGRYSYSPKEGCVIVSHFDPNTPIESWRNAWEAARKRAGITVRFHDLRHTALSRMITDEATLLRIAKIMGWSASTMREMALRYLHLSLDEKRMIMASLLNPDENMTNEKAVATPKGKSTTNPSIELHKAPKSQSAVERLRPHYDREALYKRVWEVPVRTLAKEYGVSDVALGKTCKRLRIPVPGRGYWEKKAAGLPVPDRPPLPNTADADETLSEVARSRDDDGSSEG